MAKQRNDAVLNATIGFLDLASRHGLFSKVGIRRSGVRTALIGTLKPP